MECAVRYAGVTRFFMSMMFRSSGVVEELYGSLGWCVRPINQTGIFIGVIAQEPAPCCDQPRIPVRMLGIKVSCHKNRNTTAKAGTQVQAD
jgi:hypothetical protein